MTDAELCFDTGLILKEFCGSDGRVKRKKERATMAGARCSVARREKVMATCFALPLAQRPRSIAILTLDHPFSVLVLWISILHPTTPVFNSLFDFDNSLY